MLNNDCALSTSAAQASVDYSLATSLQRGRERKESWQLALSQSLLHYVTVPNNTALLHKAHLLLSALE